MFKVKIVPDGGVMVFCRYCAQGAFFEDESPTGIRTVKRWMYHHIVDAHRMYRYTRMYAYPR